MTFRIKLGGVTIETDEADDVAKVVTRLAPELFEAQVTAPASAVAAPPPLGSRERTERFGSHHDDSLASAILKKLQSAPSGVHRRDLYRLGQTGSIRKSISEMRRRGQVRVDLGMVMLTKASAEASAKASTSAPMPAAQPRRVERLEGLSAQSRAQTLVLEILKKGPLLRPDLSAAALPTLKRELPQLTERKVSKALENAIQRLKRSRHVQRTATGLWQIIAKS